MVELYAWAIGFKEKTIMWKTYPTFFFRLFFRGKKIRLWKVNKKNKIKATLSVTWLASFICCRGKTKQGTGNESLTWLSYFYFGVTYAFFHYFCSIGPLLLLPWLLVVCWRPTQRNLITLSCHLFSTAFFVCKWLFNVPKRFKDGWRRTGGEYTCVAWFESHICSLRQVLYR